MILGIERERRGTGKFTSLDEIMTAHRLDDPTLDVCRVSRSPVTLANGLVTTAQQELETASPQILSQAAEFPAFWP